MYRTGQKVRYINEVGGGFIKEIKASGQLIIRDEEGFDYTVDPSQVFVVNAELDDRMMGKVPKAISSPKPKLKKLKGLSRSKPKQTSILVVDLHIEKVYPNYRQLDKTEILDRQIGYFKAQLIKAKSKKLKKLVVIHGVGEGKLRKKVHQILDSDQKISYHDAPYWLYGQGATQIDFC